MSKAEAKADAKKSPAKPAASAAAGSKDDAKAPGKVTLPGGIDKNDKRAVCEQYMPYVRSIAGKIKKTVAKDIDFEDLVEYGMIGLLEAADRYDPKFGANFMTFAYYRIRGAIYDGLRGMGWMSRSEYAKARFEERANEYLSDIAAEAGATGTRDAGEGQMSTFEHAVQDLATAVQGLAAVYITTIDGTEGLQLKDDKTPLAEENLGLEQARALVRETIKKLSGQERQLLEMYYYKDMSLPPRSGRKARAFEELDEPSACARDRQAASHAGGFPELSSLRSMAWGRPLAAALRCNKANHASRLEIMNIGGHICAQRWMRAALRTRRQPFT
jgi:RNA polymerase sigma factor for flagellar operon FliA